MSSLADYGAQPLKLMPQTYYNKLKGGIDGITQFVEKLTGHSKAELKTTIEQKLTIRTIKQLEAMAAILFRVRKVETGDRSRRWSKVGEFRRHCNKLPSIPMIGMEISLGLLKRATDASKVTGVNNPDQGDVASTNGMMTQYQATNLIAETKYAEKRRKKQFHYLSNDPRFKRMRLSANLDHSPVRHDAKYISSSNRIKCPQRACILCGRGVVYSCPTCLVPVCVVGTPGSHHRTTSCNVKLHRSMRLPEYVPALRYHTEPTESAD